MKELRRLMEAWSAWRQRVERLEAQREACRMELDTLAGQERALAGEMERAGSEFTELNGRYEEWLHQHNLPEGLSPEGLPDIFVRVEQGNELLRQQHKLASRLQELEAECSAYEHEVLALMNEARAAMEESSVLPASSESAAANQTQSGPQLSTLAEVPLLSWLEQSKREWDLLQMELLRREGSAARLLEVEAELAGSSLALEELTQRSLELLEEGGAEGGEEFLRRSAAVQLRTELTRAIRQWELAMFGGWEHTGVSELLTLLEHHDAYGLEQERNAAEIAAAGIEEERNALLEHRGKLLKEREHLMERCMEDSVLQQLEEQRAALRRIAGQYAVTALAAELMGRTRRIYEQEKQPQVLRLASDYFAKLTEGEYRRVVMTLGHKELKVEHKDTGLLDSGLLSRGTAEQLYLAIRLALAETMARQAKLPLLFDDLFVNFDERRLHAALALLGELAASRQIVMMTCHRHVAEAAAAIIPAATVISV